MDDDVLFRDEVFKIQGAVFEVSREMGVGYLEAVYQECLALEFASWHSFRRFAAFSDPI